jgi:hypothetical protein
MLVIAVCIKSREKFLIKKKHETKDRKCYFYGSHSIKQNKNMLKQNWKRGQFPTKLMNMWMEDQK